MQLRWLELRTFRSYAVLEFHPEPEVNVLLGRNGAGKTNLLEAIDYAARGVSFRGATDEQMISLGHEESVVRAGFTTRRREITVEAAIRHPGRNELFVNGKKLKRRSDLTTAVATVVFRPEDLELVKGGPAYRRNFVDGIAVRMYPGASAEQRAFGRILRQRNGLLRRGTDSTMLDVWDQRLSAAGAAVVARRVRMLRELGPSVEAAYRVIAGSAVETSWEYRSSWTSGEGGEEQLRGELVKALRERRRVDVERRVTSRGPQRDDSVFLLEGRDPRGFASQGEQRSLALALRMGSHLLLTRHHQAPPVLLLDDVFSELDQGRAAAVVASLPKGQVFVTTARDDDIPLQGRRWEIRGGIIR